MFGQIVSNNKALLLANPSVSHQMGISDKTPQSSSLIERVHVLLNQIDLEEGPVAERNEAKALASYVIKKYDLKSLLTEADEDISQSRENFERFLEQITGGDPALKFFEVNARDELFRSDLQLTRFYSERLGVDIRVCKLPDVVKSVENLVRTHNYGFVSGFTPHGWAKESGLRVGDKILSSGQCHLASATHETMISGLRSTRDITLAPLCFFHSAPTQYLIICTPLAPSLELGLRAATE